MKRILSAALMPLLAMTAGCATKTFVLEQTAPLAERVGTLEKRLAAVDAQIADLTGRPVVTPADLDAVRRESAESRAQAQQAIQSAQAEAGNAAAAAARAETAAARSETAASRSEAAAAQAEGAAKRAEQSAGKSVKAFELQQKK